MLEKKKRSNKKMLMLVLSLSMVMANGIVAFAKTLSGTSYGISYTFVGSVIQDGSSLSATGSTQASIDTSDLGKANNYVSVYVDKEFTNAKGVKEVARVKEKKLIKKRTVSMPAQLVPKSANDHPVTARVGHSYSSNGASYFAYTIY